MLNLLRPMQVRNMHETVDAFLDADKNPEVGDIPHRSINNAADRIFFLRRLPGIRHHLFEPKGDSAVSGIDVQDDHLDLLADLKDFRRMGDLSRPRHFGNMNQPLDAAFQFDESAVVHQADYLALHSRTDGIFFCHGVPRIGSELFHAQGNAFLLAVEFEHDDFDFFAHSNDLRWMVDPPPRHVADVENAVDAAEIDEGTIAGNVFHRAFQNHALFEDF